MSADRKPDKDTPDQPRPDWLRTDDWLKITPRPDAPPPADPPDLTEQPTELIDDAVLLDDELTDDHVPLLDVPPADDEKQPSSVLLGQLTDVPLGELPADASGYLPIPPSALIDQVRADTDTDPDADIAIGDERPTGGTPSSFSRLAKAEPASGWSARPADGIEPGSDIFSGFGTGSDVMPGSGGGSHLFPGAGDPGSSVFADAGPAPLGESDLFSGGPLDPARGSSVFDTQSKVTQRLSGPDFGLGSDDPPVTTPGPSVDFDRLDALSGSDLLGDLTGDANLTDAAGVDLSDPEMAALADLGPASSIFKGGPDDPSNDAGRVNLDHIPLMGSTDDRTEAMLGMDAEDGPSSSVFAGADGSDDGDHAIPFDASSRGPKSGPDSGKIAWGSPGADQPSDRLATATVPDDDFVPDFPSSAGGVSDDEVRIGAAAAGLTGPASSGMFGQPSSAGRGRAVPRLPGQSSAEVNLTDVPATGTGRKLLTGLAAGLVVGLGVGGGAMHFASSPNSVPLPASGGGTQTAAANPAPAAPPPGGTASALALVAGDPAAALAAFEALADDTTVTKSGRGQARWMARARAAAAGNQKLVASDAELTKAAADLKAAVEAAAAENTPDAQLAGARAALHLGLIAEATNRPDDALTAYTDGARAFPAFKKWFDSARQRVTVMRKGADGSVLKEFSMLAPADANRLATAVILLDFPPVQQTEDEPGFHFWEAIQLSTNWSRGKVAFDEAIAKLNAARAAHDARRKKYVGLGLNPASDPREQMFLRACDELRFYWTFKAQVYGDATALAMAKGGKGTGAILGDLLKANAQLAAVAPKLKAAEDAAATAKKAADDASASLKTAVTEKEAAAKAATDAKAEVAAARAEATKAADALKVADAALDPVIEKLKAAKLIDAKATRAEALAALPAAAGKAAVVGGGTGGNESELAKQLAAAQQELQTAKKTADDLVKATEAKLADATKTAEAKAKEAIDAAAREKATTEAKAKELAAAVAARDEASGKLDAVRKQAADATAERDKLAAQMAAREEQFRSQLAAAKAGAAVMVVDADRAAADRAGRAYGAAVEAYFAGRYSDAERLLTPVSADLDARGWYFLGLSQWTLGRPAEAEASFRKGVELESRGVPGRREVGEALARVQGPARAALSRIR